MTIQAAKKVNGLAIGPNSGLTAWVVVTSAPGMTSVQLRAPCDPVAHQ